MSDHVEMQTLTHRAPFGSEGPQLCAPLRFTRGVYPIAMVFAQHLDPSFAPPDTLIREDSYFHSASGCGGGRDVEQRGTQEQGLLWDDWITEHAADESAVGDWAAYGLAAGCELRVGRYERTSGEYQLHVTGPAPLAEDVLHAWVVLLAIGTGVTADHARDALARSIGQRS